VASLLANAFRLPASAAITTPSATTEIMMVQIALISGFTPSLTWE
jgi:hypothetical protein